MHLTGEYPKWWTGRVFEKPIVSWAAGVTSEVTRDSVQRVLMGRANMIGTGAIPKKRIKDHSMKRGVADAIDTVTVIHGGGGDVQAGESLLGFKSYDQGREKFQAETLDYVWLDEEPDIDIYTESLTRTNATGGCVAITFTPLFGMSQVVKRFLTDRPAGTTVITMTIADALHYSDEMRQSIINSYPPHERDARTRGIPTLGSGAVFPVNEKDITINPIELPAHWPRIRGIDFGWDHPFAWVSLAWDRDSDTVYVYDEYRKTQATPKDHVADLREKPDFEWIPVIWPHDGLQHDKGSGVALADTYRNLGLPMRHEKFSNPPQPGEDEGTGGNGVEVGVLDMLARMQGGRWKVFSTCQSWLEEFRQYHREDGKIVKIDDDLISASRYASMSLRFAETKPLPRRRSVGLVGVSNW
jgi:phage terminase large subunit-like protein